MRKKVFGVIMAASLVVSLAGCGASNNKNSDTQNAVSSNQDISAAQYADSIKADAENYKKFLTMPEYKNLTVALDAKLEAVTDADVEDYIKNLISQYGTTESLTEASKTFYADNLDKLEAELEELEYDYNAFGADGFYAIPLKNFKREFPEFFKGVIATFLKSIVDIDVDTEDPEELNDAWQSGDLITEQDWKALFEGAHVLLDNNGKGYGWIAIWKKYYNNFE